MVACKCLLDQCYSVAAVDWSWKTSAPQFSWHRSSPPIDRSTSFEGCCSCGVGGLVIARQAATDVVACHCTSASLAVALVENTCTHCAYIPILVLHSANSKTCHEMDLQQLRRQMFCSCWPTTGVAIRRSTEATCPLPPVGAYSVTEVSTMHRNTSCLLYTSDAADE